MISTELIITIGYNLLSAIAVFVLRNKYPRRYLVGVILCLIAPSWGQWYAQGKKDLYVFLVFTVLWNKMADSANGNGLTTLVSFLIISVLSAGVIYYRMSTTPRPGMPGTDPSDPDKNYVAELNKKLIDANVETERDLL